MLRQHFSFAWRTFFFAVVAAVVLVYLSQYIAGISELAVMNKIANGLSIAVWVVLWRPFEMLIHDWRPLDREYRLYRRLEGIQVESIAD
jgi:chromate transport protein ChrA